MGGQILPSKMTNTVRIKLLVKRFIVSKILRRNLPISLVITDDDISLKIEELPYYSGKEKERKIFCNINFDDLCPKYFDAFGLDFGGRPGEGVALAFESLLRDYPFIGITHFLIPLCQIEKSLFLNTCSRDRYDVSSPAHHGWINFYKDLAVTYNIEYAQHGYCHRQYENIFFARHTEFAYKDEDESFQAIKVGLEILNRAGIEVCGFRQPGWDISSDLSICRVLQSLRFVYIAGSSSDAGFNAVDQRVSNYFPALINGIVNFPQNVLLDWDLLRMKDEIDKIVEMNGFISIKGHFVNEGMPNSFNTENISKLRAALHYLMKQYSKQISFVTLKDAALTLKQQRSFQRNTTENKNEY
jgi:hypothetical protein